MGLHKNPGVFTFQDCPSITAASKQKLNTDRTILHPSGIKLIDLLLKSDSGFLVPILNNSLLLSHKAVELHGYIHGPLNTPAPPHPYAPLTHHSFLYAVSRPCSHHRGELNTQIQKLMPKTCRLGFIYPFPSYP